MGSKYQAYPEYKDSGVEWLGEIPSHWSMRQLKFLCTFNDEVLSESLDAEYEIEYVDIGSVSAIDGIQKTEIMQLGNAPSRARRIVRDGDVIISTVRTYLETIASIDCPPENLVVSTGFTVIRPNEYLHKHFAAYCLRAKGFIKEVVARSVGVSYPAINASDLVNIKVPVPIFGEQEDIANFLDHETAKIDTLIEKQQQLIKLLKEKRQVITSNAITPRSGEKTTKLGHLIDLKSGYSFQSEQFSQDEEGIRLLRGINVGVGDCRWTETVYWTGVIDYKTLEFSLEKDDIVLGMDRPWISSGTRVAQINEEDLPCLLVQRVARIRSRAGQNQSFIRLVLESNEFKSYLEADMTGVSVPHISPEQICGFPMRVLPQSQQYQITTQAEQKFLKLDALMSEANYAIDLLQERRTALISAAVTGKIDVRDWQPPNG